MTQNKSNDKKTNNEKKENFQSTEKENKKKLNISNQAGTCLLYTSPSPRDTRYSRMPSSA